MSLASVRLRGALGILGLVAPMGQPEGPLPGKAEGVVEACRESSLRCDLIKAPRGYQNPTCNGWAQSAFWIPPRVSSHLQPQKYFLNTWDLNLGNSSCWVDKPLNNLLVDLVLQQEWEDCPTVRKKNKKVLTLDRVI